MHVSKSKNDSDELTRAQLEFAQEEAGKAALREQELAERRRQLRKDTGAMRMLIVDNSDAKRRELENGRKEAEIMRQENMKRKRLEERKKKEIFQKKQEQIAKLRGDLERAAMQKEFQKRNLLREEIDFKISLVRRQEEKKEAEKRIVDHENRQIRHKYLSMLKRKEKDIADEKIRKARQKKGIERSTKYAKAAADEKRAQTNAKFREKKLWMKDSRIKRQLIEQKATFSFKSKEARWWEAWDEENQCTYWEREAGRGCKGDNFTYTSPFEPEWIDIYEEYHELWYKYNVRSEATTLWDEIEKKKQGFEQFAAKKTPGIPTSVMFDQVAEDLDNPSAGITWNVPVDSGDQPMEYCILEGATVLHDQVQLEKEQLAFVLIADGLPLDCDYYEAHAQNFAGFSDLISARALQGMPGAPQPDLKFYFRVAFCSSVGVGIYGYSELLNFGIDEIDEEEEVEEKILPIIAVAKPMHSRRRKKKGPVEMYQFKF